MMTRTSLTLDKLCAWDLAWCERMNRASHRQDVCTLFRSVSRLGDGAFWYALWVAILLVKGGAGVWPVLHMALTGIICTCSYKALKAYTLRPRPYQIHQVIRLGATPLDHFSFPSGHTLHAVAFTIMLAWYFPATAWLCVPFTTLVAISRPVLGLHYPTDVMAGAVLGAGIAWVSLGMF